MGRKGPKSLLRRRQPVPLLPQPPQSPESPVPQQPDLPEESMFHSEPDGVAADPDSGNSQQPVLKSAAAVKRAHIPAVVAEPEAASKQSRLEPAAGRNGGYHQDHEAIQMAEKIYWNIGECDEDELYCERAPFTGRVIKKLKQPRSRSQLSGQEDEAESAQHYEATSQPPAVEQSVPQQQSTPPPAADPEPVQVRKLHIDLPNSKLYLISPLATRSLPHSVNCSRAGNSGGDKLYLLMQQEPKANGPADTAESPGESAASTRLTLIRSKNTCDCRSFRENLHKILPGIVDRITRGSKTQPANQQQHQTTDPADPEKSNGRIRSNGLAELAAAAAKVQQRSSPEVTCGATPVIVSNAGYLAKKLASMGGAAAPDNAAKKPANPTQAASEEKAALNGGPPATGSKENLLGLLDYPAQSLKHAMVTVFLKDGDRSIEKVMPLTSDLTYLISLLPYMERLPAARKDVIKETIKTLLLCQLRYN